MRVVVVTKPTNLEQHGEVIRAQVEQGNVNLDNLNYLKEAHEEHYRTLERVKNALHREKIQFFEVDRNISWGDKGPFDAVFTVGGDGTLLSASHRVTDDSIPLIGIRSSGSSVGYLCAGGEPEVDDLVRGFRAKTLRYTPRARLYARVFDARKNEAKVTVPVLNDFLFTNSNPCATTRYNLRIGSCEESQKSSGIWISTATGSTAGISAAGGRPQPSTDKLFQYFVRELYKHTPTQCDLTGGFFDPDKEAFTVENRSESCVLALDGQREVIPLYFGDYFSVMRAQPAKIAEPI